LVTGHKGGVMTGPERARNIALVNEFVHIFRKVDKVIVEAGSKPEPSCIHFGEGKNLLYSQLVTTPDGESEWLQLQYDDTLQVVVEAVANEVQGFCKSRGFTLADDFPLWKQEFKRRSQGEA
jgi:hypothetical protein